MNGTKIRHIITSIVVLLIMTVILGGCGARNSAASGGIVARCIDGNGNPVEGASVLFCTDKTCQTVVSDSKGETVFRDSQGTLEIHVLRAPAGYTTITTETKKTDAKSGEFIFVFAKDGENFGQQQETTTAEREPVEKTLLGKLVYREEWDPALFTDQSYERVNTDLSDKILPGKDPLKFSTVDINGNPVDESIFKKADVTLINFFEDWCQWCVFELPALVEISNQYNDHNFQIIGVYTGTSLEVVSPSSAEGIRDLIDRFDIPYLLIDNTDSLQEAAGDIRPVSLFVDSEGRILRIKDEEFYSKTAVMESDGDVDLNYFWNKTDMSDPETVAELEDGMREYEQNYVKSYEIDPDAFKVSILEKNPPVAMEDSYVYQGLFLGSKDIKTWNQYIRYFLGMETE